MNEPEWPSERDGGTVAEQPPDLSRVFSALASADRLAVLAELQRAAQSPAGSGARTISDVARALEMSRFSASRHLGILRAAELIECVRSEGKALHRLAFRSLQAVEDWLYPLLDTTAVVPPSTAQRLPRGELS